jgi:CheY-like chemotaxis protein
VTVYLKINNVTQEDLKKFVKLPVLVVDDEEAACESACEILRSMEMLAEYVLSGDAAVESVLDAHRKGNDFALIILDWKMPEKDGIETTREIRQLMGNDIPIIVLTAYDWSDIEQEAAEAGVNAFIEKPLFKSRLTHVLKEVLGLHEDEISGKQASKAVRTPHFAGKRVLLVEDNELNVEVAAEILHMMGITVETAFNGQKAVEMVTSHKPAYYDMVFMDIQMPVMNGYHATEEIRRSNRQDLKELPIIAMTADAFADDVRKAQDAGMNGHIAKPVDIPKLQEILKRFLGDNTQ